MPNELTWLPNPTPLDLAEDPPGSIDPLGTLAHAERLADALLPGLTARMWRVRLLTFATVAAAVADRTVALMQDREDRRLEARLAFERLCVAAIVQMALRNPMEYGGAEQGLPGRDLATAAWRAEEPLTRTNFLKGQAVNGPVGVILRLARNLELIDEGARLGRRATDLLLAWSDDEGLSGILDEGRGSNRPGSAWLAEAAKHTAATVGDRAWPTKSQKIWTDLADHLRPDRIAKAEKGMLIHLLRLDPVRRRMLELFVQNVSIYQAAVDRGGRRGSIEREVLLNGIKPMLTEDPVDRRIAALTAAADAYEQTSSCLQQAFDGVVWSLVHHGGRAAGNTVLADARLRRHLEKTRGGLVPSNSKLRASVEGLRGEPSVFAGELVEPLERLSDDATEAAVSADALANTVLRRHERVQKGKNKACWIERNERWTLMPGDYRANGPAPPVWEGTYLHPFKIQNAYSMLRELQLVKIEDGDARED